MRSWIQLLLFLKLLLKLILFNLAILQLHSKFIIISFSSPSDSKELLDIRQYNKRSSTKRWVNQKGNKGSLWNSYVMNEKLMFKCYKIAHWTHIVLERFNVIAEKRKSRNSSFPRTWAGHLVVSIISCSHL